MESSKLRLNVEGMACADCASRVETALQDVPGVTGVQVDLSRSTAVVHGRAPMLALIQAVTAAGYVAQPAQSRSICGSVRSWNG